MCILVCRFGGVYFDLDVLLLRDFRSILDREFAEWWGTSRWDINTAILRLEANSSLIHAILDGVYQIIEEASTHEYAKAKVNGAALFFLMTIVVYMAFVPRGSVIVAVCSGKFCFAAVTGASENDPGIYRQGWIRRQFSDFPKRILRPQLGL